jgi:hypothetical protein
MRWRPGELVFGGGAILLGIAIPIAMAFGEVNRWKANGTTPISQMSSPAVAKQETIA